jgi:hypothetical protein
MTDLEMTKLCAEAMGWRPAGERKDFDVVKAIPVEQFPGAPHYQYAPLNDDSSAMALVKKFRLGINSWNPEYQVWVQSTEITSDESARTCSFNADLNRAIVECVAKMQAAFP